MPKKGYKKGPDGKFYKVDGESPASICGAVQALQGAVDGMENPTQKGDASRWLALVATSFGLRQSRSEGNAVWVDG